MEEERTIEESFALLDEIERKMEEEDLPLEEAFSLYEKSMNILKDVSEKVDRVEKKIRILAKDGSLRPLDET